MEDFSGKSFGFKILAPVDSVNSLIPDTLADIDLCSLKSRSSRSSVQLPAIGHLLRLLANPPPSLLHVPSLGVRLADAQAQRELSVELGVREEEVAAAVQGLHDDLIRRVS